MCLQKKLAKLKEIGATGGGSMSMYYLCKYQNGKMVLFNMTDQKVNGKYFIQDIIEVPDEMRKIFENDRKR